MNQVLFSNIKTPSLTVVEDATASRNLQLASFSTIYFFGQSSEGDITDEFVAVGSHSQFRDEFGTPVTAEEIIVDDSIKFIFLNDPSARVEFFKIDVPMGEDGVIDTVVRNTAYASKINALKNEDNLEPGILIAPIPSATKVINNALIGAAKKLDFITYVCGRNIFDASVMDDFTTLDASPKGYAVGFHPWLTETFSGDDRTIPACVAGAVISTKRWKLEGYKPGAGIKYPIAGAKAGFTYIKSVQEEFYDNQINLIRDIRKAGTVVWGASTLSNVSLYKPIHNRVISSVVNHTFRRSMELRLNLFDLIDGRGLLLNFLKDSAKSVGRQLFRSGLLYGATEAQAFEAKCDLTNNPTDSLQAGNVLLEFTYAIAPHVEKMVFVTRLAEIGRVQAASTQGSSDVA